MEVAVVLGFSIMVVAVPYVRMENPECGGLSYNSSTQQCCSGITVDLFDSADSRLHCCEQQTYNMITQLCCDGSVFYKHCKLVRCCGKKIYCRGHQRCCGARRIIDKHQMCPSFLPKF